ncbi:hypothetical protein EKD04_004245 [Chloroflexales bacterium ZM16-3]|nr:hypothetical protein [Chloroflexales bacterium ZM16-3]
MRHRITAASILTLALLGLLIPLAARASDGPEWLGTISSRPSGTTGDWIIGGRTFSANAATRIKEEHGPLSSGTCTEVKYYISGAANIATEIDSQEPYKCGGTGGGDNGGGSGDNGHRDSYARVEQFPAGLTGDWIIGGATYVATSATRFEQKNGTFAIGSCVEIKFGLVSLVNTATEIETAPSYKCDGTSGNPSTSRSQAYGVLGVFPAGLIGAWDIGGVSYTATTATRFEREHGPFFSGGCVDVKFQPGTPNTALEIKMTNAYRCTSTPTRPESLKVYGLVSGEVPAVNQAGVWTIGGVQYTATTATRFELEHRALGVGSCASVEYSVITGVNTATKISSEELTKCNTSTYHNHIYGVISAMPTALYGTWTINGMMIDANAATRFEREKGSLAVGGCAEASYYVQNGVNYADKIEARSASGCGGSATPSLPTTAKIYAPIDSFPTSPYTGAWVIGGVNYSADSATRFEQEKNAFDVGICVEARYTTQSGTNTLLSIESKSDTRCQVNATTVLRAYGVIEALPSPAGPGTWQVSGVDYSATASTLLKQEQGFFAVGAYVEVTYEVSGATLTALKIETHVAPGSGRTTRVVDLQRRPTEDTGEWMIEGETETYWGDPAIDVQISANSTQALAAVSPNKVMINSYRGPDGVQYITSIVTVVQQIYLPIIQR